MPKPAFETSVFINCPFDKDYEGLLQALMFCLVYVGLTPRIASERANSAEARLQKIEQLIEASKYSIHDLSRCQAEKSGDYFRLNMPFELGIDWGCRKYFGSGRDKKSILVLEKEPFRYRAAISDLAGFDIKYHGNDFQQCIRQVRNWITNEAKLTCDGATKIFKAYLAFQEWYYERQLERGFSEADIQDYPTAELLRAMQDWMAQGKPLPKTTGETD